MYFAKINENNIVLQVIVADQDFINGQPGTWIQTDASGVSPKNYASPGYTWDAGRNAFIAPKPSLCPSFVLNETLCQWIPPIAYPNDGKKYYWNEDILNWELA